MRVWFLKETKSFCTSCATGCNTIIGTRGERNLSADAAQTDAVNSSLDVRLRPAQFRLLQSEQRLREPMVRTENKLNRRPGSARSKMRVEFEAMTDRRLAFSPPGRMTNEEMWLTARLAKFLSVTLIDIVPRTDLATTSCSAKTATRIPTVHVCLDRLRRRERIYKGLKDAVRSASSKR
jgi:NADH-quinone oxidoreductase subunit G